MIQKLLLFVMAIAFYSVSVAQTLMPSDTESTIGFVIKNMGINVDGSLTGLKGKIDLNAKKSAVASFDVTVDVRTINTENKRRDEHLKKDDFFDVEKYPTIRLRSTSIQSKGKDTYFAKAVLTMHGISKNIQFNFVTKPATGGYHFNADFKVNRKDFGIGGNSMTMGDEVMVQLSVLAKK